MSSLLQVSVVLPTYNPDYNYLCQTLEGLKRQTLDLQAWELIIVDNNSSNDALNNIDITWHPYHKIIKETKQGLTFSRIAGFDQAQADIIILVDDDNVLEPNYLQNALNLFEQDSELGTIGGKVIGNFENPPKPWTASLLGMLAIRDLGEKTLISAGDLTNGYPAFAPAGAGMVIRRFLTQVYIDSLGKSDHSITDRTANSLSSGGDNEINIVVLKQGFRVAYSPELKLTHLIPKSRLTKSYLAKLNYASSKSWVKLLLKHQICPWARVDSNTIFLRKVKAWFSYKAWKSPENYIYWRGACGLFEGLGSVS